MLGVGSPRPHSSLQSAMLRHPSNWIKGRVHSPTERGLLSTQMRSKSWLIQLVQLPQNAFRFSLLLIWTAQSRVAKGASSPCPSPSHCNGRGGWLRVNGETPLRSPLGCSLVCSYILREWGIRIWEAIRSPMTACWGQECVWKMTSKQSLMGLFPSVFPGHRASC